MVNKSLILIVVIALFSSCFYRSDSGMKRLFIRKGSIMVQDSIFKVIDTSALYELVNVEQLWYGTVKPYIDFKKSFLKFYSNGRVATFYYFDDNDKKAIKPEKADIGYYFSKKGRIFLKTHFDHPQGGGFVVEEMISAFGDTLILRSGKQKKEDYYLNTYKKIKLKKEFLIYKPDW